MMNTFAGLNDRSRGKVNERSEWRSIPDAVSSVPAGAARSRGIRHEAIEHNRRLK